MAILERRLTLEEFLKLPEVKPALEFWQGRVVQKVSPQGKHGWLTYTFAERINRFAVPRELAMAIPELRATYGGQSLVPDIAVYRWGRVPLDPDGEVANRFEEPPDIAIEIVSPDQSISSQVEKCLWFVANGAEIALLVDPYEKLIILFRPAEAPLVLRASDRVDLDSVLPGFELTAQELFDTLRPGSRG